jgi:NADPH-dependent glutamate synthase beta subunit-like oxidoreductase
MALLKKPEKNRPFVAHWGAARALASPMRPQQMEKPPPCGCHCPIGNDVRAAMSVVAHHGKLGMDEDDAWDLAWRLITATNPFPAVMGRVCSRACEQHCNRAEKDEAVAISAFERFVGDWGISRRLEPDRVAGATPTGKKIAVVGAGPAGLSCAYQLARRGHGVTVFETYPRAGGMLRYGIPEHRLGRAVLDSEIGRLCKLDVALRTDFKVGTDIAFDDLRRDFDAVFVAIGAHVGRPAAVPGSDGGGVLSGIEFLRGANSAGKLRIGPKVIVVGDGPTAVDVARVACRLGRAAKTPNLAVTLLRSHTREEEALDDLLREGVSVEYSIMPIEIIRDRAGRLAGVNARPATLQPPDANGLRLPRATEGPVRSLAADTVVFAFGQTPDWAQLGLTESFLRNQVDPWGRTPLAGVWSGGDDVVLGNAARSVGQGLRAALGIDAHLAGRSLGDPADRVPVSTERVKLGLYDPVPRVSSNVLTHEQSLDLWWAEVDQGLTKDQAAAEASRCLSCGACFGCERCWMYCTPGCFHKVSSPSPGSVFFDLSLSTCDGCRKCSDMCPSGFLEMA